MHFSSQGWQVLLLALLLLCCWAGLTPTRGAWARLVVHVCRVVLLQMLGLV